MKTIIACAFILVSLGGVRARSAASPARSEPKQTYLPASVHAHSGLKCRLHPVGTASETGITVYSDDDGYVRFHAVRAAAGSGTQDLSLDCIDERGLSSSYVVDLNSNDVFAPHALNVSQQRGTDRPALQGDPNLYTQQDLITRGYGLRPDPATNPAAYARWLQAASAPGRLLQETRPAPRSQTITPIGGSSWIGTVLLGAPPYVSTEAMFNVPTAIAGGEGTSVTAVSIWNGLGGYGTGSGLIQGGITLDTTSTVAVYGSFREYCCGDPHSNGYGGAFTPSPNDQIYSQEWYCDANGHPNVNGGYGCTFLHDITAGAIMSCTAANGSPCLSVPALPLCSVNPKAANCMTLGRAAEFIVEDQTPQVSATQTAFTDFTPRLTMSGSATSTIPGEYSETVTTDPDVLLLLDTTNAQTHVDVSVGSTNETYFDVFPKPFMLYSDSQKSPNGIAGWVGAQALGGLALQVDSAQDKDGRLEIFYIGTNHLIYHNWQTTPNGPWNGEVALGGSAQQLAVVQNLDGRLELFYVGTDNAIYHNYQAVPNGAWVGQQVFGGYAKQVAPIRNADGRLELFFIGTDTGLYHSWQIAPGAGWSPEYAFSGDFAKQITVAINASGTLEMFYVGTNDGLYHNWQVSPGGSWAGETRFSGDSAKQVVSGRDSDGRLEIFYVGTNNDLYHNYQTSPGGSWFGETRFAQNSAEQIAVGTNADGRLEIFYVGTDSNIYHNWQTTPNGGWAGQARLDKQAKQVNVGKELNGKLELIYISN